MISNDEQHAPAGRRSLRPGRLDELLGHVDGSARSALAAEIAHMLGRGAVHARVSSSDLDNLDHRAAEATPGPWESHGTHVYARRTRNRRGFDTKVEGSNRADNLANATYMGAAHPKIVRQLIAAYRDALQQISVVSELLAAVLLDPDPHMEVGEEAEYDTLEDILASLCRHRGNITPAGYRAGFSPRSTGHHKDATASSSSSVNADSADAARLSDGNDRQQEHGTVASSASVRFRRVIEGLLPGEIPWDPGTTIGTFDVATTPRT